MFPILWFFPVPWLIRFSELPYGFTWFAGVGDRAVSPIIDPMFDIGKSFIAQSLYFVSPLFGSDLIHPRLVLLYPLDFSLSRAAIRFLSVLALCSTIIPACFLIGASSDMKSRVRLRDILIGVTHFLKLVANGIFLLLYKSQTHFRLSIT